MDSTSLPSLPVIVASCLGGVSALLANLISIMMVEKINEGLPEGRRLSIFWWGTEIRKEFKHRCPSSRLALFRDACVVLVILCFAFVVFRDLS